MQGKTNRTINLTSHPVGLPTHSDLQQVVRPIPQLKDGEVLLRNTYVSVDPYMRGNLIDFALLKFSNMFLGRMRKESPIAFTLNEPIFAAGAGVVEESKRGAFAPGDLIVGSPVLWGDFTILTEQQAASFKKTSDPETALSSTVSLKV